MTDFIMHLAEVFGFAALFLVLVHLSTGDRNP